MKRRWKVSVKEEKAASMKKEKALAQRRKCENEWRKKAWGSYGKEEKKKKKA